MEFIMKLPLVAEKNTILVVCNRLSTIVYFVVAMEEISVEELVRLFRNNVQKLHELPESVILDRKPQFVVKLTKELNSILGIKTKELEQYLRFFTEYRQRDWLEWLVIVDLVMNNKVHSATKVSLFIANYSRELKIGVNTKRKEKVENAMEFVERIKKAHKEARVVLRKVQEKIKRQVA